MIEIKHIDKALENGRFVLLDDGKEIGEMTYTYAGVDKAVFDHTFVHPDYRGGNKAALLMDRAMAWVREKGLSIFPLCPYVDRMIRVLPDKYGDLPLAEFEINELTGELQPCNVPSDNPKKREMNYD